MTDEQTESKKELKYVLGILSIIVGCIIVAAILL